MLRIPDPFQGLIQSPVAVTWYGEVGRDRQGVESHLWQSLKLPKARCSCFNIFFAQCFAG